MVTLVKGGVESMPGERSALNAHGVISHRFKGQEIILILRGYVAESGRLFCGQEGVKRFMERLYFAEGPAFDKGAHYGGRCFADGTALPFKANVLDGRPIYLQGQVYLIAT